MLRLGQLVRVVLTAVAFAGFIGGAIFLSWLVVPVVLLIERGQAERRRACQRLVRHALGYFHGYMRRCRLIAFDPRTVAAETVRRPCVLVANHPTLVDATAILSVFAETVCVVKSPLYRGRALGRLLRSCWYIDSGAIAGLAGGSVLPEALERLREGTSVLIFPEGTRSRGGREMGAFKRGAFEIAIRAGVPVVPILISCDPPILSKEAPWYRAPRRVPQHRLQLLPPLDPQEWKGRSRAMAAHVQQLFQDRLDAPAAASPR